MHSLNDYTPREPIMQIRHKSILFYSVATKPAKQRHHLLNHPTYTGKTTTGSQKRIKKAVDLLCQLSPPRKVFNPISERYENHTLSFITLTIPGKERHIEAREGHKLLLEPWLLTMRRKAFLKTYIWKAEFQKNGQLHYHVTTPQWIHYQLIKDTWNNLMSKNGLLENWFQEHPYSMPNSTDVHKVYKVKNIAGYLMKYLSKNEQDKATKGKIWDCSMNLKKNKLYSCSCDDQLYFNLPQNKVKHSDYCSIYFHENPKSLLNKEDLKQYNNYLNGIQKIETVNALFKE